MNGQNQLAPVACYAPCYAPCYALWYIDYLHAGNLPSVKISPTHVLVEAHVRIGSSGRGEKNSLNPL